MAKTCDICGVPLGLFKFRYAEGLICRNCYDAATAGGRETVRQMTRAELEEAIQARQGALEDVPDFRANLRVGDVLLVDQERKLFCLPHNRRTDGTNAKPEVIAWDDVRGVRLVSDPAYSTSELKALSRASPDVVVRRLCIEIRVAHQAHPSTLCLFTTPVRAKSFAYRQSLALALRAMELLEQVVK